MKFGVNYTPSNGWFHSWLHQDWDSASRDLDAIAGLGMDHVRIFPLWPVLQPNRTWINEAGLEDVRHMAQLADDRGLDVFSDVLQGHLSSFDFVPSWLVTWHERNMFTDANAVEAETALIQAVYGALSDIPHFKGLTIGNECNQFAYHGHPRHLDVRPEDVDDWFHALLDPIKDRAKRNGHVLVHAENDAVWYDDHHAFEPRHASGVGDMTAIHSWVFNGTAQHYGPLSPISTRHAEYLIELSKAFSATPDHPVWLQEIGAPQNVIEESDIVRFCRDAVGHALDCSNLYGITWWCSHDVNRCMSDFPSFEHDLGLFDERGEVKAIGREFARLAAEYREGRTAGVRTTALVVQTDERGNPTFRSACGPGGSVFEHWMELSMRGVQPAIVSSRTAVHADALAERGITNCIEGGMRPGGLYNAVSDSSRLHVAQR